MSAVKDNLQKSIEELKQTKYELSSSYFKNAKVLSCERTLYKNGRSVAIPFKQIKTGYKADGSYINYSRSSETESIMG